MYPIAILGGGLAGISTLLSLQNQSAINVLLIEKQPTLGGNSAKATSGINGARTMHQDRLDIKDSYDLFINDTLQSGHGLSNEKLVILLARESSDAIKFVEKNTGLILNQVQKCGGHSIARTHKEQNGATAAAIGFRIINEMKKSINDRVQIMINYKCTRVVVLEGEAVGIEVEQIDPNTKTVIQQYCIRTSSVILATGGFGYNVFNILTAEQIRLSPQLKLISQVYDEKSDEISTTNGDWTTGDAVIFAEQIGAKVIDLEQVQVHPTSFIDPKSPRKRSKMLAPESLRAVGGILISPVTGKRFVDELARRDIVTDAILKNCLIGKMEDYNPQNPKVFAYLVLTEDMVEKFGKSAISFYASKGLFRKIVIGSLEFAVDMKGVDANYLSNELKFKQNIQAVVWVASITPSIHYTMVVCYFN